MKLTKKLLEQYITKVMKEAWQQKLFGGEEEIVPPTPAIQPQQEPEPMPSPINRMISHPKNVFQVREFYINQHLKDVNFAAMDLGIPEYKKFYWQNRTWKSMSEKEGFWGKEVEALVDNEGNPIDLYRIKDGDILPKITNITKFGSGRTDVDYSDGDVFSHLPGNVDPEYVGVRRGNYRRRRW